MHSLQDSVSRSDVTEATPAPPVSSNSLLLSTNPLQASQTLYAAAASGMEPIMWDRQCFGGTAVLMGRRGSRLDNSEWGDGIV